MKGNIPMQAKDVMTTKVASVSVDTGVSEIAKLMLDRRISAVPVVDRHDHAVGIVSEGDLMRRPESETERHHSWWLTMVAMPEERAADYVKTHGLRAEDVMSQPVISVEEETPVGEIAQLLEERNIKRVPVISDGKIVGIVSRADLLRGLASGGQSTADVSADDQSVRERILAELERQEWFKNSGASVIVTDGVANLWGIIYSEEERNALRVAAERTPGVRATEDHLIEIPHWWTYPGEKDYD